MSNMTVERLKQVIEAYGADASRWPEEEREAALNLARITPEIEEILTHHKRIDLALNRMEGVDVPVYLRDQIVKIGVNSVPLRNEASQVGRRSLAGSRMWVSVSDWLREISAIPLMPAGLYIAAGLLGIVVGLSTPIAGMTDTNALSDQDLMDVAFAATDYIVPGTDGASMNEYTLQ